MANIPSDAEFGILTVLWRSGPSTVREVHEALAKDTGYTSTLKQMQVMHEKACCGAASAIDLTFMKPPSPERKPRRASPAI